jgi:hypothetical protein
MEWQQFFPLERVTVLGYGIALADPQLVSEQEGS